MMKKVMLSMLAVLLMATGLIAQTTWTYSQYNLEFTTPSGFEVETNNDEEFTGSTDNIFLAIYPWEDETVTNDQLDDYVIAFAEEMGYDEITDGDNLELNGYEGAYIEGTIDGVNAIVLGLLDPYGSSNFFVVIGYSDDGYDEALDIATSIQKAE